jgi:predicted metal-dependent HD superfamily phosphohydrolase
MLFPMLASRWNHLCENAELDSLAGWNAIATAYGDPGRAYHNLGHIADCLRLLDQYAGIAADPVAMEFAIWFHDIVYDPRAADNEERSADRAVEFLSTTPHAATVADLIMATKHGTHALSADAALICDIDLSILGRPPAEYAAYAAAIRLEYAWVPPPQYAEGRSRVLGGFLKREALFHHMEFQQRFDAPAKVNLTWELRELAAELPGQSQPAIP